MTARTKPVATGQADRTRKQTAPKQRNRAAFNLPKDMDARIEEHRKSRPDWFKDCCGEAVAYDIGCKDGEVEALAFYRGLMEDNPMNYGGRLAKLLIAAAGIGPNDTAENSYRRGWFVGIGFALECWMYQLACRYHHGR